MKISFYYNYTQTANEYTGKVYREITTNEGVFLLVSLSEVEAAIQKAPKRVFLVDIKDITAVHEEKTDFISVAENVLNGLQLFLQEIKSNTR